MCCKIFNTPFFLVNIHFLLYILKVLVLKIKLAWNALFVLIICMCFVQELSFVFLLTDQQELSRLHIWWWQSCSRLRWYLLYFNLLWNQPREKNKKGKNHQRDSMSLHFSSGRRMKLVWIIHLDSSILLYSL